ncbi:MAG: hypothetical protein LPK80_10410 [Bacteroidota bacterium]|nr:hypothetical protein [Bacteroidota bacterium]
MRPKFFWETHMPFFDLEEVRSNSIKNEVHVGLVDCNLYYKGGVIHNNSFLVTLNPKTQSLTIQARWIKGVKDFTVFHNSPDPGSFERSVKEMKGEIEKRILDYMSKSISFSQ